MAFRTPELIAKKRDGERLGADEIRWLIDGVAAGTIPDYQVAALLMAIYIRGLAPEELAVWADAMLRSGDVLDLSEIDRPKIDKHSTGGVGDKISLALAPAAAACGVAVPMISGRGLEHTGGTLDKLESIPGFSVELAIDRFRRIVDEVGAAIIGQTERIVPADRALYALRDVTATVDSIPLIASSILSKKLAEGIDGLVLDCKVGAGAFMKTRARAAELARAMKGIGETAGKRVTVVLTRMDAPIGTRVGNALEVGEAIAVLRGDGPPDTRELVVRLGAEMLVLGDVCADAGEGATRIGAALDDGRALAVFRRMVDAQGGDPRVADDPEAVLPAAREREPVPAPAGGHVQAVAALDVGVAALELGAGRRSKADRIDPAVGVELARKTGEAVAAGEPLAFLHHNGHGVEQARERVLAAYAIGDEAPEVPGTRVLEVLR